MQAVPQWLPHLHSLYSAVLQCRAWLAILQLLCSARLPVKTHVKPASKAEARASDARQEVLVMKAAGHGTTAPQRARARAPRRFVGARLGPGLRPRVAERAPHAMHCVGEEELRFSEYRGK